MKSPREAPRFWTARAPGNHAVSTRGGETGMPVALPEGQIADGTLAHRRGEHPSAVGSGLTIVAEHLELVRNLARSMRRHAPTVDLEDLIGYGTVGLMKAARTWRPDGGACFKTWAHYKITGEIMDSLRRDGWYSRSDVAYYHARGEQRIRFVDVETADREPARRPAPDDELDARRRHHRVRAALANLDGTDRRLLKLMYTDPDLNLVQAAARLGIGKSWACRIRQRAIAQLREALAAEAA